MNSDQPENFLKIQLRKDRYEYFSKGILSTSLHSIGMDPNLVFEIASKVEQIVSASSDPISKEELVQIITSEIKCIDPKIAERYIVFEGGQSYKPIIILLAGVPGIGKSTIASQLSQRLEISYIIGTDMIRQVLRQTISSKLIPELHSSSYEAYKKLKPKLNPILRQSIVGYEEQCRHVIVGVESAIQTALYSRENSIIEGVHLAPNILNPSVLDETHVILILLYLEEKEEHKRRIQERGTEVELRKPDRYINAFSEIRNIQTYLVEEATKAKIPIIETSESGEALKKIMDKVWERIVMLDKQEKKAEKKKKKTKLPINQ
ncbi:MAG: AAA family ATPase [Candidatus Heimdallarchaeota archaeon]|nr:AAA family ATPase [Candidatus Heimdallarchaeota archaeon]MCK4254007.1 AAA family ATPase [Candidatus Heimdallarchaeota archaeon]